MKRFLQVTMIFFFLSTLFGVPALTEKIYYLHQPDGTVLKAKLVGDEFLHFFVDEEGFPIVRRSDGWWVYGVFEDGKLIPTERVVGKNAPVYPGEIPRIKVSYTKSLPSTGALKLIVILVNFSDTSVTFSREDFQELLFGENPPQATGPGSLKDYFFEVSGGKVTLTGDVVDWVVVSNPHDYYAPFYRAPELVREAVNLVDPYVDFSKYDNDGDGYVDNVLIIHQGRGQEESGDLTDIWSHSWYVSPPILTDDDVYVSRYTIQPERFEDHISQIGVICHELGHAFGLPDLYDTDYSSIGIWDWGLMGHGCWNKLVNYGDCPAHLTGWSKKELGWVIVSEVETGLNEIFPVETVKSVLRYPGEGGEYFLLEYRKLIGFDSALPGEGLIIYHVDEVNGNQNNDSHRLVDVEEADEIESKETQDGDPFPQPGNDSFGPSTNPNSLFYSGEESGLDIEDIHFEGEKIVFFQKSYTLTVTTAPSTGLSIKIDGVFYTSPKSLEVEEGNHTIEVMTPQETDESTWVVGSDTRYIFNEWNDESTENPRSVYVNSDATYIASMNVYYYIDFEVEGSGVINKSDGWYESQKQLTTSTTPATSYIFDHWEVNGQVFNDNPLVLNVDEPKYVKAVFTVLNEPPNVPRDPNPPDNATNVSVNVTLSWSCNDPDGDSLTYDIYFGTNGTPSLVASDIASNTYNPGTLQYSTTYYWKVIAKDGKDETEGPLWKFTTQSTPQHTLTVTTTPDVGLSIKIDGVSYTSPKSLMVDEENHTIEVISPQYKDKGAWIAGNDTKYVFDEWDDGNTSNPRNVYVDSDITCTASMEVYYYIDFEVVGDGVVDKGDGWYSEGKDMVVTAIPSSGYTFDHWEVNGQIFNTDSLSLAVDEPKYVKAVFTLKNHPPSTPTNPNPPDGEMGISTNPTLSWDCSDPDGDTLTYDVYFGTSNNPPLVKADYTSTTYNPGTLDYGRTYYWKIVAKDGKGGVTEGPVWRFTTISNASVFLSNIETAKDQPFIVEIDFVSEVSLSGTLVVDFPSTILSVSGGTYEDGKILFEIDGTSFSGSFVGLVDDDVTLSASFPGVTLSVEGGNISVLSVHKCDFDLDGDVDLDDLEILKEHWYEDYVPCDVVYNGRVDFEDLMEFVMDYRKGKR